jgi:hypothetical protein
MRAHHQPEDADEAHAGWPNVDEPTRYRRPVRNLGRRDELPGHREADDMRDAVAEEECRQDHAH